MRFSIQASLRLFFPKISKFQKSQNLKKLKICTYLRNFRDRAKRTIIWDHTHCKWQQLKIIKKIPNFLNFTKFQKFPKNSPISETVRDRENQTKIWEHTHCQWLKLIFFLIFFFFLNLKKKKFIKVKLSEIFRKFKKTYICTFHR